MSFWQARLFSISCFITENFHLFVMARHLQAQNEPLPFPFQVRRLLLFNCSVIFLKSFTAFGCHGIEHLS